MDLRRSGDHFPAYASHGIRGGKAAKVDFPTACGMLCGAMANPMALDYSNSTMECDAPSVGYATAYPLAMFSRVVVAQLLVLLFCIS